MCRQARIIRQSRHHWRSQHHLPQANIIQKTHLCRKTKVRFLLVGVTGFEHATSWSRTKRSTKLSHTPIFYFKAYMSNFLYYRFASASRFPVATKALPSFANSLAGRRVAATQNISLYPPQAAQGVFPQTEHTPIFYFKAYMSNFLYYRFASASRFPVATKALPSFANSLAGRRVADTQNISLYPPQAAQGVFPQTEHTPIFYFKAYMSNSILPIRERFALYLKATTQNIVT